MMSFHLDFSALRFPVLPALIGTILRWTSRARSLYGNCDASGLSDLLPLCPPIAKDLCYGKIKQSN